MRSKGFLFFPDAFNCSQNVQKENASFYRIELIKGGKKMTLFSVFYVPDGIVMLSDSRLTLNIKNEDGHINHEILSDNEQKIFLLRNEDIGMVYTADEMPEGFRMSEFVENMNEFLIKPNDTIFDVAFNIRNHIEGVGISSYSIVVAGYDNGSPYVYLIENGLISTLNRDERDETLYRVTIGGNLDRVNQWFDFESSVDDFTLKESLNLGCYILMDSIEYFNKDEEYSNVGGDIQFLIIKKTGEIITGKIKKFLNN